ncbi:MAG: hypothetical protein KDA68_05255 [Planctomycetaceae bacterium]|nr:hypothetical protein [Planctomycetaceae bacterium]
MADLKDPRLMYLKGILFLGIGLLSSGLLLLLAGTWQVAVLLVLAIWSFCRLYYFMFYVIEHYVDGSFKFAGILSFLRYLFTPQKRD